MDASHQIINIAIGAGAATAGTSTVNGAVYLHPAGGRLVSLQFTPDRNVTANDTNNCDISVELSGTEVASEVTSTGDTGDLSQGTAIEVAVTASGADLEVAQGDGVSVKATKGGSGVAIGGVVTCLFAFDRAGA